MTRKLSGILLALGIACAGIAITPAASNADASTRFKVLSYNIHNPELDTQQHTTTTWEQRRDGVVKVIKAESPGIFGVQETTSRNSDGLDHADWLNTQFTGYASYPSLSYLEPGQTSGYSSTHIYFKTSRFTPLRDGAGAVRAGTRKFVQGSAAYKLDCSVQDNRKMNWIILTDTSTGRNYFVASTHLYSNRNGTDCVDYRVTAAHQIHAEINEHNRENYPVVLMGDFNNRSADCSTTSAGRPIGILTEAADDDHVYNLDPTVALGTCTAANTSFNAGWDSSTANDGAGTIDWIFRSKSLSVVSTSINKLITWNMGDGTTSSPSDHYAMIATLDPTP